MHWCLNILLVSQREQWISTQQCNHTLSQHLLLFISGTSFVTQCLSLYPNSTARTQLIPPRLSLAANLIRLSQVSTLCVRHFSCLISVFYCSQKNVPCPFKQWDWGHCVVQEHEGKWCKCFLTNGILCLVGGQCSMYGEAANQSHTHVCFAL